MLRIVATLPNLGYTIIPDQLTRHDRTSVLWGSHGPMEAVVGGRVAVKGGGFWVCKGVGSLEGGETWFDGWKDGWEGWMDGAGQS